MKEIELLVDKIKTLKSNPDYRFTDVAYGHGYRSSHSGQQVLTNPRYADTILKDYLILRGNGDGVDLDLLYKCTSKYKERFDVSVPSDDEIVIHMRAGDVIETGWVKGSITTYPNKLIARINEVVSKNTINKITMVTCFAYQEWSTDSLHLKPSGVSTFEYTEEKQNKNRMVMFDILFKLNTAFDGKVDVKSSEKSDEDIVYCTHAKFFLEDQRQPRTGGFSRFMKRINNIHNGVKNANLT